MQPVTVWGMVDDVERVRKAFAKFMKLNKLSGRAVSIQGGLSPSAAQQFMNGNSRSPKADTFAKFAKGAAAEMGRPVSVAEITGEIATGGVPEIPIRSYVGAGDEIIQLHDDDPPIDWTPPPPGLEDAEGTLVRGSSMVPLYREGDLLFHRRLTIDPRRLRDEVVILQTKAGKRYVKLLQPGTTKGTFRLVSINPLFPPLDNQVLVWVAPILWVRKRQLI